MSTTYGRVVWDEGAWQITATPDVTTRLKRIFVRASPNRAGTLRLEYSAESARDLEWALERWPMVVEETARARIAEGAVEHRGRGEAVTEILAGQRQHRDLPLAPQEQMRPRQYQLQAYDMLATTGSLMLADELGLGKTLASLLTLSEPGNRPLLVVTLTGLERQWVRELNKTFPALRGVAVTKGRPYDLTDAAGRAPDMVVMNYAKLAGWADHLRGVARTVVFDEVQELRRDTSQRHRAACQVAGAAQLVAGLSATPVYNFGGEMFSILQVLAPDLVGDRREFAREWCVTDYGGLNPKTRISEPAAFRSWLSAQGVFLRRTRQEVGIEMPPLSTTEQFVDVDEDVWERESGNAMEIAKLILAQDTEHRTRWKATGEFDWKMRQATGLAKAPFVAEFAKLLLESEEKIILLGWHRAVWDIWAERLADYHPVLYTGSESAAQKARAFDDFVHGDARVMMLSLRSGAGLDGFQDVTQTVVFGELDWSPGVHKQAVGRAHRPGQNRPVNAYFCVTDYGADPVMMDLLNIKKMEAELLINPEPVTAAVEQAAPVEGIRAVAQQILDRSAARRPRRSHRSHGKNLTAAAAVPSPRTEEMS